MESYIKTELIVYKIMVEIMKIKLFSEKNKWISAFHPEICSNLIAKRSWSSWKSAKNRWRSLLILKASDILTRKTMARCRPHLRPSICIPAASVTLDSPYPNMVTLIIYIERVLIAWFKVKLPQNPQIEVLIFISSFSN